MIYRVTETDGAELRVRPEGGGASHFVERDEMLLIAEAGPYYDRRIGQMPQDALSHTFRAMLYLDAGDIEGAITECDEAIRLDQRQPWGAYYRGLARLARKDVAGARSDFERATENSTADARLHWGLGRALAAGDRQRDAVMAMGRAIYRESRFAAAYRDRAASWLALRETSEARSDIEEALRLDPDDAEARCIRGEVLMVTGDNAAAIAEFDAAVRAEPAMARARLLRGTCRITLRQSSTAIEDLEQAIQRDPELIDRLFVRGHRTDVTITEKQVIDDFTNLIQADPACALFYAVRGSAFYRVGRIADALVDLNKALGLEPNNSRILYERSQALAAQLKLDLALHDFHQAEKLDPAHSGDYAEPIAEALESRGMQSILQQRYALALADFDHALRLCPQRARTYLYRGNARLYRKQYDLALADFDESIRLVPNASAYFNRALIRSMKGDHVRAIRDVDEVMTYLTEDANPRMIVARSEAFGLRARASTRLGRYASALADFDEAIGLDPGDPYLRCWRAWVEIRTGQYLRAMKDLAQFAGNWPEHARNGSRPRAGHDRLGGLP